MKTRNATAFCIAIALGCFAAPGAPSRAANITYNILDSAGSLTVAGTITTDGAIGALAITDILSWNLSVSGFGTPISIGSHVELTAPNLIATATTLSWDFSGLNGDFVLSSVGNPYAALEYFSAGAPVGTGGLILNAVHSDTDQLIQGTDDAPGLHVFGDIAAVPGPNVGAGFPGLLFAGAGLLGWLHRRRNAATA